MPIILVQTANGSQYTKLFALFLEHPICTVSSVGVTHWWYTCMPLLMWIS